MESNCTYNMKYLENILFFNRIYLSIIRYYLSTTTVKIFALYLLIELNFYYRHKNNIY